MKKVSIFDILKSKIASLGWKMFLWGNNTTQEDYWQEIYEQEKAYRNSVSIDNGR